MSQVFPSKEPLAMIATSTTTGASLKPASPSSSVRSRGAIGTRRSTENTAAASVAERAAARRMASRGSMPASQMSGTATATIVTATPTVASTMLGQSTGRRSDHRVVSPPSARMSTRAAYPRTVANSGSVTRAPGTSQPMSRPMPR